MSDGFTSLKQLAAEFGMERSNARKYALKCGFTPHRRRTADSAGQLSLCFTTDEAERLRNQRRDDGFGIACKPVKADCGYFYIIRVVPDLDPKRVKLGFADSVEDRLIQHRTAAPTAELVKSWWCRRAWERTIIDCLAANNCTLIRNEVFDCDDLDAMVRRADMLFALLMPPTEPCHDESALNDAVAA